MPACEDLQIICCFVLLVALVLLISRDRGERRYNYRHYILVHRVEMPCEKEFGSPAVFVPNYAESQNSRRINPVSVS
jgi:hypothetical protein